MSLPKLTPSPLSHEVENQGLSWSVPEWSFLDDRRGDLPEFPLDTLPPRWREWIIKAARASGGPVDYVLLPLISISSSLIGTARRVAPSTSWSEPLSLWTAVIGYSGSGKTPGLNISRNVLASIEGSREDDIYAARRQHVARAEQSKLAFKRWKEKLKKSKRASGKVPEMPPEADEPDPFVAPKFYTSDVTIQRLAMLINVRPRGMLVVRDELSGLFGNMRQSLEARPFWLEAWNGGPYSVERVQREPLNVANLLVGLTGGLQPDKLVASFRGDDDGLYARMLFGWPEEPRYTRLSDDVKEVDPELQEVLLRLDALPEVEEPKRRIALSAKARIRFEEFRRSHSERQRMLDGREREQWAKAQTHVLRLAGTLAYLDWSMPTLSRHIMGTLSDAAEPTEIDLWFIEAAIRLWETYFWPHAQAAVRLMGISDRHKHLRRALNWMRTNSKFKISREEVRVQALSRTLDADQVDHLLEQLVVAGWLQKAQQSLGGAGRPARRWYVNPALHGDARNTGNAGKAA